MAHWFVFVLICAHLVVINASAINSTFTEETNKDNNNDYHNLEDKNNTSADIVDKAEKLLGCPEDYKVRVQTCIIEAQVAPQAGGGLSLIQDRNKLDELCVRGTLDKAIACLKDIHYRCYDDPHKRRELSMLFDLNDWQLGSDLLCEDLNLFRDHFDCLSQFSNHISSCILNSTIFFRESLIDAGMATQQTLHDITCNFAEDIVYCLDAPLSTHCPLIVVDTMVTALHRFLPPACATLPMGEDGYETLIFEGGEDIDTTP